MIVFLFVCLALTAMVIFQEGKDQRLGAIAGMGDTFWGQNRGRSFEGRIVKLTAVAAGVFLALALILNALPAGRGNSGAVQVSPETETESVIPAETEAGMTFETETDTGVMTEADASAR